MDVTNFGQLSYQEKEAEYPSSQAIGYACTFLDADGILVPSARDVNALNLIIFCDNSNHIEKKIFRNHGVIDFS